MASVPAGMRHAIANAGAGQAQALTVLSVPQDGSYDAVFDAAERLVADLAARGIEVLYDDRRGKVSPGVKFKDAELIGVPTIVTVGRGLADGNVEVRDRRTDVREEVAVDAAAEHIAGLVLRS